MVFPSLIFISEHETVNSITGKKGNVIHKFKIFKKSGEKFSFVELIALSAITCPAKLCETCQKNFPPFFDVKIEEIML